ncbi:MAG: cell division protein SepF [Bacillus thermozeamaize]|jgi:cell division inhibitor SepF|uniref:Cell division protein SepF n=1 Tax=Bacillus thermozeamaize TaxID=230954 RepID=A0A1Y3PK77_9BACI|nr:MAG: cell division protein SepF [Bacillus thermozeamaize]
MGMLTRIMHFFGLQDEVEEVYEEVAEEQVVLPNKRQQKVVSIHSQPTVRVILCEPQSYEEAQVIADHLRNRRPVVVNLQRMRKEQARRIVDFLSGTVYALSGQIQKVGADIFMCTPDNVEMEGSITDLLTQDT